MNRWSSRSRLALTVAVATIATSASAASAVATTYGPPTSDEWHVYAFSGQAVQLDLGRRWVGACSVLSTPTGTGAPAAAPGQCRQQITAEPIDDPDALNSGRVTCTPGPDAEILSDRSYPTFRDNDPLRDVAPYTLGPKAAGTAFRICIKNIDDAGRWTTYPTAHTVQFGPYKLTRPVIDRQAGAVYVACARRDRQPFVSDLGGARIRVTARVKGHTVKHVGKPNTNAKADKPIYRLKSKYLTPGARISVKCEIYSQVSRGGEGSRYPTKANTSRPFFSSDTVTTRIPR